MRYLFEVYFVVFQLIVLVVLVVFICKSYIANKEASKKFYEMEPTHEDNKKSKEKIKD